MWTGVGVVKVVRSRGNLAMHIYNFPWRKNLTGAVGDQTYSPFGFPLDRPTLGARAQGPHVGVHVVSAWGVWSVTQPHVVSSMLHTYPRVHVQLTHCACTDMRLQRALGLRTASWAHTPPAPSHVAIPQSLGRLGLWRQCLSVRGRRLDKERDTGRDWRGLLCPALPCSGGLVLWMSLQEGLTLGASGWQALCLHSCI